MKTIVAYISTIILLTACDRNTTQVPPSVDPPKMATARNGESAHLRETAADAGDDADEYLRKREAEFAAEGELSVAARSKAEQEIIDAFRRVPDIEVSEAVQCRAMHCRMVIHFASERVFKKACPSLFCPPTEENPGPRLLRNGVVVLRHPPERDGSLKATLFLNVL